MDSITSAKTVSEVVAAINDNAVYFGGTDTRTSEAKAAQYAYLSAKDSGYIDNDTIEYHLCYLADNEARFDFERALETAINYRDSE